MNLKKTTIAAVFQKCHGQNIIQGASPSGRGAQSAAINRDVRKKERRSRKQREQKRDKAKKHPQKEVNLRTHRNIGFKGK